MEKIKWYSSEIEPEFEIFGLPEYKTERELEHEIMGLLIKLKILPVKIPNESTYKHFGGYILHGIPDLIIILPTGRIFWVELKRKGGILSDYQKIAHKILAAKKQTVYIVHSLAEICDVLVYEGFLLEISSRRFKLKEN